MANTAPTIPLSITVPPQNALFTPDALAWAVDGTLVNPTLSNLTNGWIPAIPPDSRLANHLAYLQAQWNDRLSTTGFFTQRATVAVQIVSSSSPVAGDTLTLTVAALADTYIVTSADAAAGNPYMSIAAHWAQQLRTSALRNVLVGAAFLPPFMLAAYKDPGTQWPVAPTLTGTGTLATSSLSDFIGGAAGQIQTMSAPAGTEAVDTDLLHGANDPEGAGVKVQFRNGAKNGAFRAGKWTGAESDLANVGASSAAFGEDSVAASKAQIAVSAHKFGTAIGVNQWSDLHIWGQFTGASSAVLVPEAGDSGAIPIPRNSAITFEADVIGIGAYTGTLAASWRIRGTAAVDNTGGPTMTMLTSDAPITVGGQALIVGVMAADWGGSDAPPFAYTGNGALQVGFAVGAKTWIAITGSGAVSMRFSGRFRYVIAGAG